MNENNHILTNIQEKFRQGEKVVSICETYQIIGSEYKNRLLALVSNTNNGTNAIFSFGTSKWPPELFSDLIVDSIYPINDAFKLDTNPIIGSVSQFQFKIHSNNGSQTMYYYYPYCSPMFKEFSQFNNDLNSIIKDITNIKTINNSLFNWLEIYQHEDLLEIDRSIADGSVTLTKRESKFKEELEKREHEYIIYKKYRIYTATWNVNGKSSNDIYLNEWLTTNTNNDDDDGEPPDIYAIAFQELDLSPKAITFNEQRPDPVWIKKIMDSLHPGATYEELVSVRLVGMQLSVIVRQELRKNIIRYSIQTVGTGALNFLGNKGGVGVSLQLNESLLCFVNSHLAAHVHEVDRRKEDHDEIIRRMQFEYGIVRRSIDEHNHIFWIGDLNYRLTIDQPPPPSPSSSSTSLSSTSMQQHQPQQQLFTNPISDIDQLLKYDQLYIEMIQRKRVFQNYYEGKIKFQPSYKYDPGTNNFDSSEKHRSPAWCDRILWKGDNIQQLSYNSCMNIQLSDHKPVYALFLCGIKTKDEQKYKKVHEDVLKRVDKYENDNQPQITVEKTDIGFDIIQFNELYIRDFTVANNCHLPVHFEFRGKDGRGSKICENWLQVEPTQGELITGDSLSIRLKLFIDSHTAWRMHRKQKESKCKVPLDILVLHVENGRDIFITIIGEYRPSCFGFSVETLVRLNEPICDYNLFDLMQIEKSTQQYMLPNRIGIPREIYTLIDYLYKNGMQTPHLFMIDRKYNKNPNINDIRDWLDTWDTGDFVGTPHTTAEALLMLLESSPEPLFSPLEDECLFAENFDKCCELIKMLSTCKKNVFIYLCTFLQDLLQFQQHNRLDIIKLSTIFGRVLLQGNRLTSNYYRTLSDKEQCERRTAFMITFLSNDIREFALCNTIS